MSVVGNPRVLTGIDAVDIPRFRAVVERRPRLLIRVFTEGELEYANGRRDPARHLAVRFAAKEAVGKLLGSGVTSWQEIEVEGGGQPRVKLGGRAAGAAHRLGLGPISLSLSHTDTMAVASASALAYRP